MKINNAPKTNSLSFKTVVNKTKIIIAFLILCVMFGSAALGQDNDLTALAPDKVLDEASMDSFWLPIKFGLTSEMQVPISDPNWLKIGQDNLKLQNAIREKWATRDLIGKTKKEAIDVVFSDVKLFVTDLETLKKSGLSGTATPKRRIPMKLCRQLLILRKYQSRLLILRKHRIRPRPKE